MILLPISKADISIPRKKIDAIFGTISGTFISLLNTITLIKIITILKSVGDLVKYVHRFNDANRRLQNSNLSFGWRLNGRYLITFLLVSSYSSFSR